MNKLDLYMQMAKTGMGTTWPHGIPFFPSKPKPIKQCLECGKDHKHNNSWCSTECCKAYKVSHET